MFLSRGDERSDEASDDFRAEGGPLRRCRPVAEKNWKKDECVAGAKRIMMYQASHEGYHSTIWKVDRGQAISGVVVGATAMGL